MNILITGAAGFIGAHTARQLKEKGYNIVLVDNFNNYYDPTLKELRLKDFNLTTEPLYKIDIADYYNLEKIFRKHKFNKILHLAAQAGVRYSLSYPQIYETTNLKGSLNILELARHYQVSQIVLASSSSVYGANKKVPFSENDRVDKPISLYAATKRANELMAYTYHNLFGIKITALRYFTVYGPYGRPDMAAFLFAESIIKREPIKVFNYGQMERDFTYIDDIVEGTIQAMEKEFSYEIINLGNSRPLPLMDFIRLIEESLGQKAAKKMLPLQPGDVSRTYADISKAQKLLNWQPKVNLEEGIKKFIDWFREYRNV